MGNMNYLNYKIIEGEHTIIMVQSVSLARKKKNYPDHKNDGVEFCCNGDSITQES